MQRGAISYVSTAYTLVMVGLAACGGARLEQVPQERRVLFEMDASLPARQNNVQATIWLPAPVADRHQELGRLQVRAYGGEATEGYDAKGNRILSVTGLPPLRLGYVVAVRRFRAVPPRDSAERGELPADSPWLEAASRAPLELVRREALFKASARPDVLGKARLLYDSVVDELQYGKPDGGRWGQGDLQWVCSAKVGNCSDFHTLFIAYCQSVEIPAIFEIGYPLPEDLGAEFRSLNGYHCWAKFQVPGMGWLPVDASEARKNPEMRDFFFGGLTEHRVRLTRGRDLALNPRQKGPRLNFFVHPYAEAGGIDVSEELRWGVRARDLAPPRG